MKPPDRTLSPCVGVCQLRAGTDLCDGCLRTVAEITEWREASDSRRVAILASVAARAALETAAAPAAG